MIPEVASLGETRGVRIDLTPHMELPDLRGSDLTCVIEPVMDYQLSMTVDGNPVLEIEKAHQITLHEPGFSRAQEVLDVCAKAMGISEVYGAAMVTFDYSTKTFAVVDPKEWKLVRVEP